MVWVRDQLREISSSTETIKQFWAVLQDAKQNRAYSGIIGEWSEIEEYTVDIAIDSNQDSLFSDTDIPESSIINYPYAGWLNIQFGFGEPSGGDAAYLRVAVDGNCPEGPAPEFNVDLFTSNPFISGGTPLSDYIYTYSESLLFDNLQTGLGGGQTVMCFQDIPTILYSNTFAVRVGCSQEFTSITLSSEIY